MRQISGSCGKFVLFVATSAISYQSPMDETLLHEIFGVSKSYRATKTEIKHGALFVAVEPLDKLLIYPECRSRDVIRKGKRTRRVQTLPIGFHPVYIETQVPRCQCKSVRSAGTSLRSLPLLPCLRALHPNVGPVRLRAEPGDDAERRGRMDALELDTVKNIVKAALAKDYGKPRLKEVGYLGIDEIHLGKTRRIYMIVIDLEDERILCATSPVEAKRPCGSSGGVWAWPRPRSRASHSHTFNVVSSAPTCHTHWNRSPRAPPKGAPPPHQCHWPGQNRPSCSNSHS
jgi:hypothetical protein